VGSTLSKAGVLSSSRLGTKGTLPRRSYLDGISPGVEIRAWPLQLVFSAGLWQLGW
jgi:hypothetical protein